MCRSATAQRHIPLSGTSGFTTGTLDLAALELSRQNILAWFQASAAMPKTSGNSVLVQSWADQSGRALLAEQVIPGRHNFTTGSDFDSVGLHKHAA